MALELFDVESPNEPVKEADSVNVEIEIKDENILEMNIKVGETIDNDSSTKNEPVFVFTDVNKANCHEHENPVDTNDELEKSENSSNHSEDETGELLDVNEMEKQSVKEPHVFYTQVESNLEVIEETTDKQGDNEINQEKTEERDMENIGLVIVSDNVDIEAPSEPAMEVDSCNAETVKKIEEVLEMNIKVEESSTKHADSGKENEIITLVYNDQEKKENHESFDANAPAEEIINIQDVPLLELEKTERSFELLEKKENHESVDTNASAEEIIDVQDVPLLELEKMEGSFELSEKKENHESVDTNALGAEIIDVQDVPLLELEKTEISFELLNDITEIGPLKEPITEFKIADVQPSEGKNVDIKEEDMTKQGEQMSETNQVGIEAMESETIVSVPFIPKRLDEPIEFIDSETLEVTHDNDSEQPTEMSEEIVKEASFPLNKEKFIFDEKSPSELEELKVELIPAVHPCLIQSLGASSLQSAAGSEDNVELQGASADPIKSPGRSGIRKPEWMRKSLVRKGSVRRLFGRMKSKRFNHDRLPVTPPSQSTAPQRPLRQIIVDFLLLLFES